MKHLTLKQARDAKGWTQEELESRSGVAQSVISRLENDADADPAWSTVKSLAAALDRDPRALKFGTHAEVA